MVEWNNIIGVLGLAATLVTITGYSIKEIVDSYKYRKNNRTSNGKYRKIKLPIRVWVAVSIAIVILFLFKSGVLSLKFFPDWDMPDIYTEQQMIMTNTDFDKEYNLKLANKADEPDQATGKFQLFDKNRKKLECSSGFIISSDGIVVVPAFVVKNKLADSAEFVTSTKTYKVDSVLNYSSTFDLALLKLLLDKDEETKHILLGNAQKVSEGDDITLIGTPYYEDKLTNELSKGTISKKNYENKVGIQEMIGKISTENGVSGGPILNQNKEVIGICRTYSTDGSNKSYITPVNTLEFLIKASNKEKISIKMLNNKINKSYDADNNAIRGEIVNLENPEIQEAIGYNLYKKTGVKTVYRNKIVEEDKLKYHGLVYANFLKNSYSEYIIDRQSKEENKYNMIEYKQTEPKGYRFGEGTINFEEENQKSIFNGRTVNLWSDKSNHVMLDLVDLEVNKYSEKPFLRYSLKNQSACYLKLDKNDQLQGKYIELKEDSISIIHYKDGKRYGIHYTIKLDSLNNPLVYKGFYEKDELKEELRQNETDFQMVNQVEKGIKWRIIDNSEAGTDIIYYDDEAWQITQDNLSIKLDKGKNIILWENTKENQNLQVSYDLKKMKVTSFFNEKPMVGEYDLKTDRVSAKKKGSNEELNDTIIDNGEFVYLSENAFLDEFKGIMYSNVSNNLYLGTIKKEKTTGFGVKMQGYMIYIGKWEGNKIKQFYVNEYQQGCFEPSGIVRILR